MTKDQQQSARDWRPCESGETVQISQRLTRRRWFRWIASGGLQAWLLGIPLSYVAWQSRRESDRHYGGIGCREMLMLIPAYKRDGLAGERAAQVREHLAECGDCWLMRKFRESEGEHEHVSK